MRKWKVPMVCSLECKTGMVERKIYESSLIGDWLLCWSTVEKWDLQVLCGVLSFSNHQSRASNICSAQIHPRGYLLPLWLDFVGHSTATIHFVDRRDCRCWILDFFFKQAAGGTPGPVASMARMQSPFQDLCRWTDSTWKSICRFPSTDASCPTDSSSNY